MSHLDTTLKLTEPGAVRDIGSGKTTLSWSHPHALDFETVVADCADQHVQIHDDFLDKPTSRRWHDPVHDRFLKFS